jgi:6-phosphogluconolactonase (cycloisomerase 2 family)
VPNLEIQDLSVHGFMIDSTSGVLTPIAGSSFPTEFAALSVTVDPSGRFVYVSKADSTVSGFNLTAATGVLVPMPGAPLRVGIGPREIEVTATTQ